MRLFNLIGFLVTSVWCLAQQPLTIAPGRHPSVTTDSKGGVHLVFGRPGEIWYTVAPSGPAFSEPFQVDTLAGLHIGASRGPQIAVSDKSVLITAIDGKGNVWAYRLDRSTGRWSRRAKVTDSPAAAPEGFVALTAAGQDDQFFAVWLDVRGDKQNKIAGASTGDGGRTWSANRLLYRSPDGTVCECCQPSVAANGKHMAVMFRNWLNGCRDMYALASHDGGRTFSDTLRLGQGTWPLKACPMDGGSLALLPDGTVETVWRRNSSLYSARGGELEKELGEGKNARVLPGANGNTYVWQNNGSIWTSTGDTSAPVRVGAGSFPKVTPVGNNRILCVWENEGKIVANVLN